MTRNSKIQTDLILKMPEKEPIKIQVDSLIANTIATLNKKGYKTIMSCSGHWETENTETRVFIIFDKPYEFIPDMFESVKQLGSNKWCFESFIPATENCVKTFNKKLYQTVKLLPEL